MNIDEIKCNISHLLEDRGLTREYKEQAVRLLLYHLYVAMDIYRYMTLSEKNKAGFWYRTFKNSYRLTGFLKERKRKRDKEKSPLHPSYKERETEVKEKEEKNPPTVADAHETFRKECLGYIGRYEEQQVADFFFYWSEAGSDGRMRFQKERYWNIETRLKRWVKNQYSVADATSAIRLKRLTKKEPEQKAVAAKREEDNARLEQEIEARKAGAVSYEEWLKMKEYESNAEIGTGT